jgi:hypothetical protein
MPGKQTPKSPSGGSSSTTDPMDAFLDLLSKATIKKDEEDNYKSLKIPQFSDGTDWEAVVFELEINLDKGWKHNNEMDIVDYLTGIQPNGAKELIEKADKLIYNVIVNASKRGSFARKQMIMASRHADAIPQVERNEGLKLFNLFQSILLNKSRDQANLPRALNNFHTIKMEKNELAKDYIARVDLAVSDLALLGEKVSLNSWLFTLANGLRNEYKICKNGVLFNKQDYHTILEVKSKILKEETVNGIDKVEKDPTQKETEIARAVFDGNCNYCAPQKKGKEIGMQEAEEGSRKWQH